MNLYQSKMTQLTVIFPIKLIFLLLHIGPKKTENTGLLPGNVISAQITLQEKQGLILI